MTIQYLVFCAASLSAACFGFEVTRANVSGVSHNCGYLGRRCPWLRTNHCATLGFDRV